MRSHIDKIRRFNRFYTRKIGVLNGGFLKSRFSLTEVRVLYELAHRRRTTAAELIGDLGIDGGYLSRILSGFQETGLLQSRIVSSDERQRELKLSPNGRREFAKLEARQRADVAQMLQPLGSKRRVQLLNAMGSIERLLDAPEHSVTGRIPASSPEERGNRLTLVVGGFVDSIWRAAAKHVAARRRCCGSSAS